MDAVTKPDWRLLARKEFPGFSITGNGQFAVLSTSSTLLAELFPDEVNARFRAHEIGSAVLKISLPESRRIFRQPNIRD
jgi:hypothetical protein